MKARPMQKEAAQMIAIRALTFLAEDADRLGRFLSETGIDPLTLRAQADTGPVLGAVLDHLLRDESLLLIFCTENGVEPETIAPAHRCLFPHAED